MNKEKGFTLIELLVVIAIIGILSGIAFVSIRGARESAYDTQIRSELSQIRSNAEQYYYDSGGAYFGYEDHDGWTNIAEQIPPCSVALLEDGGMEGEHSETTEEYQLTIEDSDQAQSYAAWAPLCADETDGGDTVYYCVDSDGDAGRYYGTGGTSVGTETDCDELFDNQFEG